MDFLGESIRLNDGDIRLAAEKLDCDEPAIRALAEVESRGGGFLSDDRPKILFEAHVFSRRTDHQFDRATPTSRRGSGTRNSTVQVANQYRRIEIAVALNETAAL